MIDLKRRQEAGEQVERKMMDILLQFTPAQVLKVCDVKFIAGAARACAFEAFSGPNDCAKPWYVGPESDDDFRKRAIETGLFNMADLNEMETASGAGLDKVAAKYNIIRRAAVIP